MQQIYYPMMTPDQAEKYRRQIQKNAFMTRENQVILQVYQKNK